MTDAQNLLSECLQSGQSISLVTDQGTVVDAAEFFSTARQESLLYICCGPSYCFPVDAASGIKCSRSGDEYSILALYFLYINRDLNYRDYFQTCRDRKIQTIGLIDKKHVLNILEGSTVSNPKIDGTRHHTLEYIMATVFGDRSNMVLDEEISGPTQTRCEKPLYPGNTIFLSKRDYAESITLAKSLLHTSNSNEKLSRTSAKASPVPPMDFQNPRALIDRISAVPKDTRPQDSSNRFVPIIIIPSSSASLLSLSNAKEFLENNRYVPAEESKRLPGKGNMVEIRRKVTINDHSQVVVCHVIDSALKLKDWDRVAAVFAQGVLWQFKGWKYDTPANLFAHIQGFHLKFDDVPLDPMIKNWNVRILSLNRTRRHLDIKASMSFWSVLEPWLKSRNAFQAAHQ